MASGFSSDQMGIIRGSAGALALAAVVLTAGYVWLPPGLLGLSPEMDFGERIAFTLKADILTFLWLAGCFGAVSRARFYSTADIRCESACKIDPISRGIGVQF